MPPLYNPYKPPPKRKKRRKRTPAPKKPRSKPKLPPKKRGPKPIHRKFEQTRIGWHLRVKAPLEYDMIMKITGRLNDPDPDLIEAISYSSIQPFFRTPMFRRMLIEYRNKGCHTSKPMTRPTPLQLKRAANRRMRVAKGLN